MKHLFSNDHIEEANGITEELKRLYIGQSLDLHWTSNLISPSVEQYLRMVENSKCSSL